MKQACDTGKTESLPVLLRSEMQVVCDLAAAIVNKIPYGKSKDLITIAPAYTLIFGPKEDYVPPRTKSKLQSINQMIQNIKIYREEMTRVRNDHLGQELEKAKIQRKKIGRTAADIKPKVGDIVLIRNEIDIRRDPYSYEPRLVGTIQILYSNLFRAPAASRWRWWAICSPVARIVPACGPGGGHEPSAFAPP